VRGRTALEVALALLVFVGGGLIGTGVTFLSVDRTPEPVPAPVISGFPDCGQDIPNVHESYRDLYRAAAAATDHGPTACQLARQGWFESQWKPDVVSPAGAVGIAQFEPPTARDYGIDPRVPEEAISAQARYMAHLMGVFNHYHRTPADVFSLALASYNHGIGNMLKNQRRNGWITWAEARPHMPKETQDYVRRITRGQVS